MQQQKACPILRALFISSMAVEAAVPLAPSPSPQFPLDPLPLPILVPLQVESHILEKHWGEFNLSRMLERSAFSCCCADDKVWLRPDHT